jgi:hypothetical protein
MCRLTGFSLSLVLVISGLVSAGDNPAKAHGIAGNRYFPGTLTFDDPAVADELVFGYSNLKHPAEDGSLVTGTSLPTAFVRLLTPDLAFGVDTAAVWRDRKGLPEQSGFETTNLTLKGLLYQNDPHEVLISAAMTWGLGGTGSKAVGGGQPGIFQPGLFFGKGFGDAPDNLAWLRPFGIAGAVTTDMPASGTSTIIGVTPGSNKLGPILNDVRETLHTGFALEYSTLYLTDRFTGGKPKEEPLNQLVPLVEFAFGSPAGAKTAATMNPGLSYVAVTYQVAAEAIVPLNHEGGRGLGFRAQLLFFLDDLAPSVFGKPLIGQQRTISHVEPF